MKQKTRLRLLVAFAGLFGLFGFDRGPLVSVAYAQRDNDDNEGGDRGGERFRGRGRGGFGGGEGGPRWGGRGRGGRGFGGGVEDGGERRRRPDSDDRPSRDSGGDSRPSSTEFAQQRVKMLDKNGNNMLEGEELEGLRGPEARADANGDKTITVEEIVTAISNRSGASNSQGDGDRRRRGSSTSNSSSDKATAADGGNGSKVYLGLAAVMSALGDEKSEKAKNEETSKRRTFRFTPAEDRLPSGLPSWFKSRDRNKDGQVSMNEYRSSWSASSVKDFTRLDANGDGVITPKEAADD